jgi:hypothetical protein
LPIGKKGSYVKDPLNQITIQPNHPDITAIDLSNNDASVEGQREDSQSGPDSSLAGKSVGKARRKASRRT